MKVLFVDEDPSALDAVRSDLSQRKITPTWATSGSIGLHLCQHIDFDLIVMELLLPDMLGFKFLVHLRDKQKIDTPVLVLSSEAETDRKVVMLKLGADRYLTKPFDRNELSATMDAIFRRAGRSQIYTVHGTSLVMNSFQRSVHVNGRPLDITPQEYHFLDCLLQRPGVVVEKEELIRTPAHKIDNRVDSLINTTIYGIRKKLDCAGIDKTCIRNVKRIGYKIITDGVMASPIIRGPIRNREERPVSRAAYEPVAK